MKMNRAVLTAVVIVVLAGAGWYMFRRGGAERIDLIERYDQAEKKGGAFNVADATLNGETKRAISAPANSRLTFRVRVPEDGWLRVSLGIKPEAWNTEGNGVYFYAGVSDGKSFEQLFNQTLNPFSGLACCCRRAR